MSEAKSARLQVLGTFGGLTEADKKEIADLVKATGSGISTEATTLLITILKNATFISDQTANILALEAVLASNSDGEVEQPDGGIEQTGNILSIVSGVTAIKTDAVLTIA